MPVVYELITLDIILQMHEIKQSISENENYDKVNGIT
jgi:hypothetical protein